MASEKNSYRDDCFQNHFHLSARSMSHRYNKSVSHLFGGRTLVSWGIFAAPRHPIIYRTMENIVELIKLEYFRKSVVNMYRYDAKWKLCMCTTGPAVLTASAREIVLGSNHTNAVDYKIYKRDFHDFGGVFKMPDDSPKTGHYMYTMQKFTIPLLADYAELTNEELEGRLISSDGKELYLIYNGTRNGFADFDTFQAFHFNVRHVLKLPKERVDSFPLNSTLLSMQDAINANIQRKINNHHNSVPTNQTEKHVFVVY